MARRIEQRRAVVRPAPGNSGIALVSRGFDGDFPMFGRVFPTLLRSGKKCTDDDQDSKNDKNKLHGFGLELTRFSVKRSV